MREEISKSLSALFLGKNLKVKLFLNVETCLCYDEILEPIGRFPGAAREVTGQRTTVHLHLARGTSAHHSVIGGTGLPLCFCFPCVHVATKQSHLSGIFSLLP